MLYDYFFQNFAQVTNPPIDPIREELVMSLVSFIGPRPNLLDLGSGGEHMRLEVDQPILTNTDLERIRRIENHVEDGAFRTYTMDITCYRRQVIAPRHGIKAIGRICDGSGTLGGYNIIVLSDRAHRSAPCCRAGAAGDRCRASSFDSRRIANRSWPRHRDW